MLRQIQRSPCRIWLTDMAEGVWWRWKWNWKWGRWSEMVHSLPVCKLSLSAEVIHTCINNWEVLWDPAIVYLPCAIKICTISSFLWKVAKLYYCGWQFVRFKWKELGITPDNHHSQGAALDLCWYNYTLHTHSPHSPAHSLTHSRMLTQLSKYSSHFSTWEGQRLSLMSMRFLGI